MNCPYCGKPTSRRYSLVKHLAGSRKYGGHEVPKALAESIADGGPVPPLDALDAAASGLGAESVKASPAYRPSPPTGDFMRDYFTRLAECKALPKYQFERRVDAMLALFLPDLLAAVKGWEVEVVVPEFPLKLRGSNQTTNADYALFRRPSEGVGAAWLLFELKTDGASIRDKQLRVYLDAQKRGMPAVRDDLDAVLSATQHTEKYQRLLSRVDAFPSAHPIEILYLTPGSAGDELRQPGLHVLSFRDLRELELSTYAEAWRAFREIVLPVLC